MKELARTTLKTAAAKAGMDVKTARKYRKLKKLPSELKKAHDWNNRKDPFAENWEEIEAMLSNEPQLQAKTVFEYLNNRCPGKYTEGQLRTLQRRFKVWRAFNGEDNDVIFLQEHTAGNQSQSDYTVMNDLNITIEGKHFKHLLFHFMLVYSRWEYVEICYTESFDSLVSGFENAVWKLGFVAKEHRTDNLSAATRNLKGQSKRSFTDRWEEVLTHYKVLPSRNNPGESHENGSIEKSHDLFKTSVDQQLMLRGSRDFDTRASYQKFLSSMIKQRNLSRQERLSHEIKSLKPLPNDRWYSPKQLDVRVSPSSTVQILGHPYSVPSRLISLILRALVYPDKISLYYGQKFILEMERIFKGSSINYRHIISSLIRKPAAFLNYQYRESLFPSSSFRAAYDLLSETTKGYYHYLKLLYLAKQYGEHQVEIAIDLLIETQKLPTESEVKALLTAAPKITPLIQVAEPDLAAYDKLRLGVLGQEVAI